MHQTTESVVDPPDHDIFGLSGSFPSIVTVLAVQPVGAICPSEVSSDGHTFSRFGTRSHDVEPWLLSGKD